MANRIDDDFGWNPYWELEGGPFIDTLPSAVAGERNGVDLGSFGTGMVVEGMNLPESQLPIKANTSSMVRTAGDTSTVPVQMGPMRRSADVDDIIGMVPAIDTESESDLRLRIGDVGRQDPMLPIPGDPAAILPQPPTNDANAVEPPAPTTPSPDVAPRPVIPIPTETARTPIEDSSDGGVAVGGSTRPDVVGPPEIPAPVTIVQQVLPTESGAREPTQVPDREEPLDRSIEPRPIQQAIGPIPSPTTDVTETTDAGIGSIGTTTPRSGEILGASPELEVPETVLTEPRTPQTTQPVEANIAPPLIQPPTTQPVEANIAPPFIQPPTQPTMTQPNASRDVAEATDIGGVMRPVDDVRPPVSAAVPTAAPEIVTRPMERVAPPDVATTSDVGAVPIIGETPPRSPGSDIPPIVPEVRTVEVAPAAVVGVAPEPTSAASRGTMEAPGIEATTDVPPARPPEAAEPTIGPAPRQDLGEPQRTETRTPTVPAGVMPNEVPTAGPARGTMTDETVTETDRVAPRAPAAPIETTEAVGGLRREEPGATSTWNPEPPPSGVAAPGTAPPPTTSGYEVVEQGDRGGGSLYGSTKDTGGGEFDERWRREHRKNEGTTLLDLMDPAMLSRMASNAVAAAAAASGGGGGGNPAMAGATFMTAAASRATATQRTDGEEATSDIPRATFGQTAEEEISAARQRAEMTRRAAAESAAAEMAASDRMGDRNRSPETAPPASEQSQMPPGSSLGRRDEDRSIFQSDVPPSRASVSEGLPPQSTGRNRADTSQNTTPPMERPAAEQGRPSTGNSGTLITGDVAREVQSVLDSSATNPEIQRAFDAMFESKRDGMKSQIREEASGVTDRAIGETFRTFLKGA